MGIAWVKSEYAIGYLRSLNHCMNPQVDTGYDMCYSRLRAYIKVYCSHALGAYSFDRSCV